jgi:hypothetical protein
MKELRTVHRLMSMTNLQTPTNASQEEVDALRVPCNLGQPADVAESHAILRMALGSESLHSLLQIRHSRYNKTLRPSRNWP